MIVKRNLEDPESCSNCGDKIGRLETPHLWKQHIVCENCYDRLSAAEARKMPVEIDYAGMADEISHIEKPRRSQPITPPPKGSIICPNPACGYIGPPKKVAKGSCLIAFILFLFFIIPAIFYMIFFSGYRIICPRCGLQIREQ